MYLFLDIDGVLNTLRSTDLWEKGPDGIPSSFIFDREAVKRINILLNAFRMDIIVHSSWKERMNLPEMRDVFAYNGVVSPLISFTPGAETKGAGILHWLESHGGIDNNSYLVVDDVYADMEDEIPERNFIHVKDGWLRGFGDAELSLAMERASVTEREAEYSIMRSHRFIQHL